MPLFIFFMSKSDEAPVTGSVVIAAFLRWRRSRVLMIPKDAWKGLKTPSMSSFNVNSSI